MKHDLVTLIGLAIICVTLWLCCKEICRVTLAIEAGDAQIRLKAK